MIEKTQSSRTYDLVEELRADIDFELEDVITEIVRELSLIHISEPTRPY